MAHVLNPVWLFCHSMDCSYQAPLSMEFSRQEHWSGLPSFSRGSSWHRDWFCISCFSYISRWMLYNWATWEAHTIQYTILIVLSAKAETPVLWPPHAKSWLIGKVSEAGRDWVQEEKGTTEDEMAGWHHWLKGHEFEWTLGVGDGQGGLACCDSWGRKESDMTEQLNWTELNWIVVRNIQLEILQKVNNIGTLKTIFLYYIY